MQYDPNNKIIQLCADGMSMEGAGKPEEASKLFLRAWEEAANDFEKCIAAHYVARHQQSVSDKLKWDKIALGLALNTDNKAAKEALPSLFLNVAKGYEDLKDPALARQHYDAALQYTHLLPQNGYGNMIKRGIMNGMERVARLAIFFLFFFITGVASWLSAQTNLLLNPGMEEPAHRQPKSWTPLGTVDFYQNGTLARTTFEGSAPKFPPPASGKNYVGIRAFDDATEILSGRLEKSMYKDRWYRVSGKVRRPAADCNTAVYGIAFVLSDTLPKSDLWYGFDKTIPYLMLKSVQSSKEQYLLSAFEWKEVVAYYQAKGGERFLWLGNFPGANAREIGYDENWTSSSTPEAEGLHCLYHYYYDDFSVTQALDPNTSVLTIRNVTFDVGSAAVTEVNEPEMNQLPVLLRDFPTWKVEVTGHTDSDGKDAANLKLSQQRADAVKKWLSEHSIAPERIVAKGMGETQPIVPNDTPENKAQNRRVEIRIGRE